MDIHSAIELVVNVARIGRDVVLSCPQGQGINSLARLYATVRGGTLRVPHWTNSEGTILDEVATAAIDSGTVAFLETTSFDPKVLEVAGQSRYSRNVAFFVHVASCPCEKPVRQCRCTGTELDTFAREKSRALYRLHVDNYALILTTEAMTHVEVNRIIDVIEKEEKKLERQ